MVNVENKTYPDWDNIIIQLNQGDSAILNIRMMRQDMEAMSKDHGQERKDIMEMMVQAIEEQIRHKDSDAVSEETAESQPE